MMADKFIPGTLVRFNDTTTNWFLAVVRKSWRDSDIDCDLSRIQFLNGDEMQVQTQQLIPIISYLQGRRRTLSIERGDLCFRVYRTALSRVRPARIKAIQKLLRSHGLRYSPAEWGSSTRIRIEPDRSFLKVPQTGVKDDLEYSALLPRSARIPESCRGSCGSVSSGPDRLHKPHWVLRPHRLGNSQTQLKLG
jgi:hypothetical protein